MKEVAFTGQIAFSRACRIPRQGDVGFAQFLGSLEADTQPLIFQAWGHLAR